MNELGLHILMEFNDCSLDILNDLESLEVAMNDAAAASKATIIKSVFHQFSPQGVTGVVVVAESHLAIHTWPEHGYAAVDFFTCNLKMDYKKAYDLLVERLNSKNHNFKSIKRGLIVSKSLENELSNS
ncbi:MAG: adenosylmethionine decarboxylase [Flavobacteriales bacterium]|nr:MAG: adenosylmethionine decarboxylase [Flavobacteriales bacterium]